jgi:REP element-mobilizing transposase RayT
MPRKARIDAPDALHHIIVRGIEKNRIFKDARDYENFLTRLGTILTETSTSCYAWALIPNHVHLLLRTGRTPITTVMRRLLTGYAQQFNRRHKRHGYLFQNRYKSFLCETDPYLLELVRYIHLNPVRAGIVKDMESLGTYPKTGHAVIMGKTKHKWQDADSILSLFGQKASSARRAYRSFIEKGFSRDRRPDLTGGGLLRSVGGWTALKELKKDDPRVISDERILGSSNFVASVLKHAQEDYKRRTLVKAMDLNGLVVAVAHWLGADESVVRSTVKERVAAQARAIIAHLAVDRLRISGAELSKHLNVTPSAVSKLASKGRIDPTSRKIEDELFGPKDKR